MLLKTHIAFSFFAYIFLFEFWESKILAFVLIMFTSVLPDIDTRKSKIGKSLFMRPIQWATKHRGIFHTFLFCIFISFLIFSFSKQISFVFLIGYSLHLFLDCLTIEGCKLFWPLKVNFSFGFKTGGIFENIVFSMFFLLDIFLIAVKI